MGYFNVKFVVYLFFTRLTYFYFFMPEHSQCYISNCLSLFYFSMQEVNLGNVYMMFHFKSSLTVYHLGQCFISNMHTSRSCLLPQKTICHMSTTFTCIRISKSRSNLKKTRPFTAVPSFTAKHSIGTCRQTWFHLQIIHGHSRNIPHVFLGLNSDVKPYVTVYISKCWSH